MFFQVLAGVSPGAELQDFEPAVRASWAWDEMEQVRNCKPAFKAGLAGGLSYSGPRRDCGVP